MNEQNATPKSACCGSHLSAAQNRLTRRSFLQGTAGAGALAASVTGLTWSSLAAAEEEPSGLQRRPLVVQPILVYETPRPRPRTSWRNWGGIQTEEDARNEVARIEAELKALLAAADFPLEFRPVAAIRNKTELTSIAGAAKADSFIVYAAGGSMDVFDEVLRTGRPMLIFCRHKSGPVYLWYEIISPRYLRQHGDVLARKGINDGDVVIDNQEGLLWRLRALCGYVNTKGARIVAIGGASGWAQPPGRIPELVRQKWGFEIIEFSYNDLGPLIIEARADSAAVQRAAQRASDYLSQPGCKLETQQQYVQNAFLLEHVLRRVMDRAGCRLITINLCMGTIMSLAETSACLTLSILNDSGCPAFCESDFVVIPSGVLLTNISGKPVFLNDPTYPHDGLITLAHCTAPRRMDGSTLEPAIIKTHFESDFGAAPKVEMRKGQVVTNIAPDFASKRWAGILGEIVDSPSMDICRSQVDVKFACDSRLLAERMPGFHWMTGYGDYMKEVGYALGKAGIEWDNLTPPKSS